MKKLIIAVLAVVIAVPSLWATQGVSGRTVKIGSYLPLSGPVGFIGQGVKKGMDVYIKWFNAELYRKFGGKKIEITYNDDQFKAEKSVQAAKNLVDGKKVFALVGAVGTPGILASLGYIKQKGIPFVYQGTGVPKLYLPPSRNVFPVQPSYIFEGRIFIKYIADHLKKKKIAFVYQSDAGVKEASDGTLIGMKQMLRKYRRKGVKIVASIPFSRGDGNFSPVASRIKDSGADAVVLFAFGGAAVAVVKAAREAGMNLKKLPFVTTYVNSDPIYFTLGGAAWNDVHVAAWAKPPVGSKGRRYARKFARVWRKYSGSRKAASPYNIAGWIAMETFSEGLKRTIKRFGRINWNNYIKAMETFHERGGWSDGMAYRISYKKFNGRPSSRFPQAYMYFVYGVNKKYKVYTRSRSLNRIFIPAY